MILGISMLSMLASIIPLVPLLLSLVLLAMAGPRWFFYFIFAELGINITYYYAIFSFDMNGILPLFNKQIYNVATKGFVTSPTQSMMLHAYEHSNWIIIDSIGSFVVLGFLVLGSFLFYRKIKLLMKGRVKKWNP